MKIKFARKNTDGQIWQWPASNMGPHRPATLQGAKVTGPDIDAFRQRGAAVYSSNFHDPQAANDNKDWPLAKLLRTERNDYCLALAERYRDLHDTATRPTELVGKEADDTFHLVQSFDKDGKPKGLKVVTGKKATVESQPTRNRAAPVPKKWQGDWPILAAIDAKRELAIIRAKLAYVPKILDAFEWSVVDSLTLEEIGKRLGAGSKGAKGEARARVFDGFELVDRHWRTQDRKAA
ncbi:hypothetical protein ACQKP1_07690 [Allorhizobium sp. NPDC080224]|uniref:hypothetical protein n=1 Tax=Allorhizobium sp. NPDC080224 TaxID=3390547 RepID=UPI003D000398